MAIELPSGRDREVISVQVTDQNGEKIEIRVFDGALPEDILHLLIEQSLIFKTNGIEGDAADDLWHGPDETLQQALCSGITRVAS